MTSDYALEQKEKDVHQNIYQALYDEHDCTAGPEDGCEVCYLPDYDPTDFEEGK